MAFDKVVDSVALETALTAIADSIRTKGKTTEALNFPDDFKSAVEGIETGADARAEIETLIDESGVLDNTEGTVAEKVEQLVEKAKYSVEREIITVTTSANNSKAVCDIFREFVDGENDLVIFKTTKNKADWVQNESVLSVVTKNINVSHFRWRDNRLQAYLGANYDAVLNVGDKYEKIKAGGLFNGI